MIRTALKTLTITSALAAAAVHAQWVPTTEGDDWIDARTGETASGRPGVPDVSRYERRIADLEKELDDLRAELRGQQLREGRPFVTPVFQNGTPAGSFLDDETRRQLDAAAEQRGRADLLMVAGGALACVLAIALAMNLIRRRYAPHT